MSVTPSRVFLLRHGETEWSITRRHTGRTDIPLTDEGRRQAERLGAPLSRERFALVLVSPLKRALETARLAGFATGETGSATGQTGFATGENSSSPAEIEPDLVEWDYGAYDGLTATDIRRERPGWTPWEGGYPGGETLDDLAARADRVLARLRPVDGDVALFAHGHILRVITARWLEQPAVMGARYYLATGTLSVLGWERETSVIDRWNDGFRVYIGGAPYPFFLPEARFRLFNWRVGVDVALGGYYNPLGYYDYYDDSYADGSLSAGALRGVVETVDYRRGSFVLRDDASGSFVTVLMRSGDRTFDAIRPGDYVNVAGDWSRAGLFNAYRADLLDDGDSYRR